MTKQGVYVILHRDSGKYYLGSSCNLSKRWREHLWDLTHNKHHSIKLQRAWNKYGADAFEFIVVRATVCSAMELRALEQKYLDKYQPHVHGYNHLFTANAKPVGIVAAATTQRNNLRWQSVTARCKLGSTMKQLWSSPEWREATTQRMRGLRRSAFSEQAKQNMRVAALAREQKRRAA